jgi:hypothetical protein
MKADWPGRVEEREYDIPRHKKQPRCEDLSYGQRPLGQPSLPGWCSDFLSKFQRSMRSDEIVVATKQLEVIFEVFVPPGLADCSATQIRRTLSDREIQPFHKRGVQFH